MVRREQEKSVVPDKGRRNKIKDVVEHRKGLKKMATIERRRLHESNAERNRGMYASVLNRLFKEIGLIVSVLVIHEDDFDLASPPPINQSIKQSIN